MADGHHRLDAVFVQLVKQIVIEPHPRWVRFGLVPLGKEAAPGDGRAEALEAHLGKKFDVLFIAVVEVDAHVVGVVFAGDDAIGDPALGVGVTRRHHIRHAQALAVFIVSALALVGGYCATP